MTHDSKQQPTTSPDLTNEELRATVDIVCSLIATNAIVIGSHINDLQANLAKVVNATAMAVRALRG